MSSRSRFAAAVLSASLARGVAAAPGAEGLEPVLLDGFESQDSCAWSDAVGLPPDGNDAEATALNLGDSDSCEASWQEPGLLAGRADIDYLRRQVAEVFGCAFDLDFSGSTLGGARLCLFVECLAGSADVTCAAGAAAATSPQGRPGCCSATGVLFETFDCVGTTDESATFWFRLDQGVGACTPYLLSGHF